VLTASIATKGSTTSLIAVSCVALPVFVAASVWFALKVMAALSFGVVTAILPVVHAPPPEQATLEVTSAPPEGEAIV